MTRRNNMKLQSGSKSLRMLSNADKKRHTLKNYEDSHPLLANTFKEKSYGYLAEPSDTFRATTRADTLSFISKDPTMSKRVKNKMMNTFSEVGKEFNIENEENSKNSRLPVIKKEVRILRQQEVFLTLIVQG